MEEETAEKATTSSAQESVEPAQEPTERADAGGDGYVEEREDFIPDEGGEPDVDLPATSGGESEEASARRVEELEPAKGPTAPGFSDLGRTGTARYGESPAFFRHWFPRAFTDGGQTKTVKWAGGGGAGARGNQGTGTLQRHIAPAFFQASPKADAWIREKTGEIDVTRSWSGVSSGDQGTGHFLTAQAAARINQHETLHVANTRGHYMTEIDPLLARVRKHTIDLATAKALAPSTPPRTILALQKTIDWSATVARFQKKDTNDNKPGGTVDKADLATGTYVRDAGPGTVAGKAYKHRVHVPTESPP